MKKSWNTTVAGIAAIITVAAGAVKLLTDGDPTTNPDWNIVAAQVAIGIGLLRARDANKSSEDEGVAPPNVNVTGATETK